MTLQEVKDYLRITENDDDTFLTELITVSETYIDISCGEAHKTDTKAMNLKPLAQKKLIHDMYEERSYTVLESSKQSPIVNTIFDYLTSFEVGEYE